MLKTRIRMVHVDIRAGWTELVTTDSAHLHGRVSAVRLSRINRIEWIGMPRHILWKQCRLIEVSPLVDGLISRRVKLNHHRRVHFRAGDIHRVCVDVSHCSNT